MPKTPIDPAAVYRLINPGLVVAISAGDDEQDNLLALTWNMPVKKQPPTVAIACGRRHYTYPLIAQTQEFAINVLDARQADALYAAGKMTGREVEDKIGRVGLTRERGEVVTAPLIAEAVANLECRVRQEIDLGSSALLLAEVVAARADSDHFEDGQWSFSRGLRLLHHLSGDRFCVSEYEHKASLRADLPN